MDSDVRTFTVDPHDERVVYMGIGPIRLFRSEDGGNKWETLDGMLDISDEVKKKWDVPPRLRGIENPHVRHIFIHPDDQNLLFVLLEHGGVLLSRDRGKTWYDRSIGIDYVDMHYIEKYPGSKERYYVSSARGFFRSDDAGEHWRRVENGMPWAYTELHSYSHEWHFLPGDTPRMVLCGGKGSPGVWVREKMNPRSHLAERRRRRKLARRDPGFGKRKSLDALGAAAPSPTRRAFLRHGRRRSRLRIRRAHQRKGRLLREPRSRRFVGAGNERHAIDIDRVGGGELTCLRLPRDSSKKS